MAEKHGLGKRGFTLVEILVGIAVISTLTSVGYFTVTNIRETARENKLEADVASVNTAVQSYLANGGSIPADASAGEVIAKLKTRASDEIGSQMMGMSGSFLDARIQPETQSSGEAGSAQLRATWNAAKQRFVVSREGGAGIKSFTLSNEQSAEAPVQETRALNIAASDVTSGQPVWVWDYADHVDNTASLGSAPSSGTASAYTAASTPSTTQLSAPIFSISSGARSLAQLAAISGVSSDGTFSVAITNPNSWVVSHLDPGTSVTAANGTWSGDARAVSNDEMWTDSPTVNAAYSVTPLALSVGITPSAQSPTPYELGVAPANGSATTTSVTTAITNWASIPGLFRQSGNFQLVMSTSGQNLSSLSGAAQQQMSETLTTSSAWDFASGSPTLTIAAMGKAVNTALFSSGSASTTITATKPTLAVSFTPASGQLDATSTVTIAANGTVPAGYVIQYTVTGASNASGSATGSSITLSPPASGAMNVAATISPPAQYANWFVSGSASVSYTIAQSNALPEGALVGSAQIDGSFQGDLIITKTSGMQVNGGAVINGDIYFKGTPAITAQNGTVQFVAPDGPNSSNNIVRVADLTGSTSPSGYQVKFDNPNSIKGKVFRRADIPDMPTVPNPPSPSGSQSITVQNPTGNPINPATYRNVTLQNNPGDVTLLAGNYGNVTVQGGAIVLGTPGATTPTVYNFQSLSIQNQGQLKVVGPVIVTVGSWSGNIDNTIGNSSNPGWLTLQIKSGNFQMNGSAKVYANIVSPTNFVGLDGTFRGSVISDSLRINGSGVLFTEPPAVGG